MEVSSKKSKIMVNSRKDIAANITMNGETLKQNDNSKYLGASLSKDSTCTAEVRIHIARATASMASPPKDMERQHQLQNQVQAVLLPGLVQLTVRLRNLDSYDRY